MRKNLGLWLICLAFLSFSFIISNHHTFAASDAPSILESQGENQDFLSPDGQFKISLPESFPDLKRQEMPVQTAIGPINTVFFMSSNANSACGVTYNDFNQIDFNKISLSRFFDGTRDGALKKVGGILERETMIQRQGYPGRSIFYQAQRNGQPLFARTDFILVHKRMYQLIYITNHNELLSAPDTTRFFDSFRILT